MFELLQCLKIPKSDPVSKTSSLRVAVIVIAVAVVRLCCLRGRRPPSPSRPLVATIASASSTSAAAGTDVVVEDEAEPEPEPGEGESAHPRRSHDLLRVAASSAAVTVMMVVVSVRRGRGVPRHDVGLHPEGGGGRAPAVLLVPHQQVLDLGLLEDDGQLVVVEEVNHRMLEGTRRKS